jgi:hypothetical protein
VKFKNITVALMIALAYEMALKMCLKLWPQLFNQPIIVGVRLLLLFIIGLIIMLFFSYFYKEEKLDKSLVRILIILLITLFVRFLFRLPITQRMSEIRLIQEILDFMKAVLLFALITVYWQTMPFVLKKMKQAAMLLAIMLGIGIIKSGYSLITFARFSVSGIETTFSPLFYQGIFIVFLITHGAEIYFLYCYYQFKFAMKR